MLYLNTLFSLIAQLSLAVTFVLTPVFIFREIGAGADVFGASEAALAGGAALIGLVLPSLMSRIHKGRLVIAGFASYGALLVALSMARSPWLVVGFFTANGMANMLFLVPNVMIFQERTTPEVRARVFGTRFALLNLTWLPMMVISGALGDVVGASTLIGLAGLLTLVTAVAGLFLPAVRDIE